MINKNQQRKLKYKYSIEREYNFIEEDSDEQNRIQQQGFQGNNTFRGRFKQINSIQYMIIETRYNWIEKYIDTDLNDTKVRGYNSQGQQIQILKFHKHSNQFQVKKIQENFISNSLSDSTNLLLKLNKKKSQYYQQNKYIIKYSQLINLNPKLSVIYPLHKSSIKIIQPNIQKKEVVCLKISQKTDKIKVLVKVNNNNQQKIQRIMIFKIINNVKQNIDNQTKELTQKYKIVWTRFQKQSFIQDLVLEGGNNYLITNICSSPSSQISLIFNQRDLQDIKIQKATYDPWRSYNLLCSSFQECSKVFMSQNIFDKTKPLQFFRGNFLDYGIILQIYQNVYSQKVSFLQDENHQDRVQDKELLFPQIYSKLHNFNVYLPSELVIKFYQVTQKPARLYFPKKKVLIGQKMAQHKTVYSTFK